MCDGPRAKWPTFPFLGKEGLCGSPVPSMTGTRIGKRPKGTLTFQAGAEEAWPNFSSAGAVIEPDLRGPSVSRSNDTAVIFMDQKDNVHHSGHQPDRQQQGWTPYPDPYLMP